MGRPENPMLPVADVAPTPKRGWAKPLFAVLCTLLLVPVFCPTAGSRFMDAVGCPHRSVALANNPNKHAGQCVQPELLLPKSFDASSVVEGKKDQIISWLSDAVKIPTEIFDVMGEIGEDKRWDVFYEFADCEWPSAIWRCEVRTNGRP